jgi:hypothetical protein
MHPVYSQEQLQAAAAAMRAYKEKPFIKHQWEEIVFKLGYGNDPALREKMYREMDEMMEKDPNFNIFKLL